MNQTLIEAAAALCGLTGAFLLAWKGPGAGRGWIWYLGSNAGWLAYAWAAGAYFLFAQQIGFTVTSCIGIWTYLLEPRYWWHEWRGDLDGRKVVMHIMHLAERGAWRLAPGSAQDGRS